MATVQEQILQANPILEAFGNAKTLRNNNSSRFGKFLQIKFDAAGGLCGAQIRNYLLEKSRVVQQLPGERNYHVFYLLLSGASDEEKAQWYLDDPEDYHYLNETGCYELEDVDEADEFAELDTALRCVGITGELREALLRSLAAVLQLGNVEFIEGASGGSEITTEEPLARAAELLRVDAEALGKCMTVRVNVIAGEKYDVPLEPEAAADARDALSKAIYARVFDWLVGKINATIDSEDATTFIGLLDIFGFETFKVNSFEQLCINFANEKLQQQYNVHTFKTQGEECRAEGIDTANITFKDNQGCLDLIEAKPVGILSLLDEECGFPKATDGTFLAKIHERHVGNNEYYAKPRLSRTAFEIAHYAATVQYESAGFLEKNKDTLRDEMNELVLNSGCDFLATLFGGGKARGGKGAGKAAGRAAGAGAGGAPRKSGKGPTVGGQFRTQLQDLVSIINSTDPHYIRCIKPNQKKKPGLFEGMSVMMQLRCAGVKETIDIRRRGFPIRLTASDFIQRFDILVPAAASGRDDRGKVDALIAAHDSIDPLECQIGKSKIFVRDGAYAELESLKEQALYDRVVLIQRNVKRWVAVNRWRRIRNGVRSVQALWRMYVVREAYLAKLEASITIQTTYRGWSVRRWMAPRLAAARAQRAAAAAAAAAAAEAAAASGGAAGGGDGALPPPPPPPSASNVSSSSPMSSSQLPPPPPSVGGAAPSTSASSRSRNKKNARGGGGGTTGGEAGSSALDALSFLRPDSDKSKDRLQDPDLVVLLRMMLGKDPTGTKGGKGNASMEIGDQELDQLHAFLSSALSVTAASRSRLSEKKRMSPLSATQVLDNIKAAAPGRSALMRRIAEQKEKAREARAKRMGGKLSAVARLAGAARLGGGAAGGAGGAGGGAGGGGAATPVIRTPTRRLTAGGGAPPVRVRQSNASDVPPPPVEGVDSDASLPPPPPSVGDDGFLAPPPPGGNPPPPPPPSTAPPPPPPSTAPPPVPSTLPPPVPVAMPPPPPPAADDDDDDDDMPPPPPAMSDDEDDDDMPPPPPED
jgi:hypothetical protein